MRISNVLHFYIICIFSGHTTLTLHHKVITLNKIVEKIVCISMSVSFYIVLIKLLCSDMPGQVAQSVSRLTQDPDVPYSIPGLAIYFLFSFP